MKVRLGSTSDCLFAPLSYEISSLKGIAELITRLGSLVHQVSSTGDVEMEGIIPNGGGHGRENGMPPFGQTGGYANGNTNGGWGDFPATNGNNGGWGTMGSPNGGASAWNL